MKPGLRTGIYWVGGFLLAGVGLYLLWPEWQSFGKTARLDPAYQGFLWASWVPVASIYIKAKLLALLVGNQLLLPAVLYLIRRRKRFSRVKDQKGSVLSERDMAMIHRNYEAWRSRKKAVVVSDRNQLWIGWDLITGEDVYLKGEALFAGICMVGGPRTGKSSRYLKVMQKQLMQDPAGKTAHVVFGLKDKDSRYYHQALESAGLGVLPWGIANIVACGLAEGALDGALMNGLIINAADAAGYGGGKDPFWINDSVRRLVDAIQELYRTTGMLPNFGEAFQHFQRIIEGLGSQARTEQSLLATLSPMFQAFTDRASRASVLFSPPAGGLHLGPLWAAPHSKLIDLGTPEPREIICGGKPEFFQGMFELQPGTRAIFDWSRLYQGTSIILPTPGSGALAERFAINFIKQSLFAWIGDQMGGAGGVLAQTHASDRYRLVMLLDEGHNFISLGENGFTDAKAIREFGEAGMVYLVATQSMSLGGKDQKKEDEFFSLMGSFLFLTVGGKERQRVLETVGKASRTKIERSYTRREETGGTIHLVTGQAQHSVAENVRTDTSTFMTEEQYGRLPLGAAILCTRGEKPRVVLCPYHDLLEVAA